MPFFLHYVLLSLVATFTTAEPIETHMTVRETSLDGKISNERLLFLKSVSTELDCASTCLKHGGCVAFSTSPAGPLPKQLTCRGHDSKSVLQTSSVAAAGSKTYFKESASSWLERPCAMDSDCPTTVANVMCFPTALKCLCQPGYYYSHCQDNCVPDKRRIHNCASQNLGQSFLAYPNRKIRGFLLEAIELCDSFEEGRIHCLNNTECHSFEVKPRKNRCPLLYATASITGTYLTVGNKTDFYQRTCI